MIRGHVFSFEEKSPFVVSGRSIYGAVEYDKDGDKLRCHDCGEYFDRLSKHIESHGYTHREYKLRHGLRLATSLVSRATSAKRSKALKDNPIHPSSGGGHLREHRRKVKANTTLNEEEQRNEKGRCFAQTAFRIACLAREIGHIPTKKEMQAHGIGQQSLFLAGRAFGAKTHNEAMKIAGLPVNPQGHKKKWDERMAWPADYFDTARMAFEQKR